MAQVTNTQWLKDGLGGGQDDEGVITQTESVIITFDGIVNNVKEAIKISGFVAGQRHRNDFDLVLQPGFEANVHQDDNAHVWVFDLTYSTINQNSFSIIDETYKPQVKVTKWTYPRTVVSDKVSGEPILLPTGEPYDSAFIEQVSAPIISITVKEYSDNIQRIEQIGAINDADIRIAGISCPKYCAMLDDYQPEAHRDEKGYLTFRNTFKIKLKFAQNKEGNTIGFTVESLAASFNEVVEGELTAIEVLDPASTEEKPKYILAATPQLVDANGAKTTVPYYQEWVVNNTTSFRSFGLPTSYPR